MFEVGYYEGISDMWGAVMTKEETLTVTLAPLCPVI